MKVAKRSKLVFALVLVAILLTAQGAPSPGGPSPAPTAVSGASKASSWAISLVGLRNDSLVPSYYEKLLAAASLEKTVDKKGAKASYRGLPLSLVIAMIDGKDASPPFVFDEARWKAGYDVTLVAKDGYAATFNTKDLAPDALIVATTENGASIPPMTVGDSAKNLWVKDLAAIETSLAPNPVDKTASFSLDLDVNGTKASFTIDELRSSPLYLEQKGSYTTSAGTKYTNLYGGVRLRGLIERYTSLRADDSVTFIAMDGYEMSYPGSRVLDEKDGVWILAFTMDGEAIPKDPGYVRTIKIGPAVPNIDGHLSVRMVKRVVVKQKDFKDFSLSLEGRLKWTLDRSTVQSCVSCHRKSVTADIKGTAAVYTGFPAWLILGYIDDPKYAPHKQDKSLPAYDGAAARSGYKVRVLAADGFSVSLDSRELDHNDEVILAMYKDDKGLPEDEFPLVLAWDRAAKLVPTAIKRVRSIASIDAAF